MAFVDITSDQHADYGTHSHGEETLFAPGGQYPSQLKWSDLHPPGVLVLPKGSPPAGPGEINWEDTLGGKFALAFEKLEGLLYAVFGSRPNGSPKRQWYDRQHPRCLWGAEAWQRQLIVGYTGCTAAGECWDYSATGKEYAALGQNPPCCPMPKPSVPIRSRSGDLAGQFAAGEHDREIFPLGSVSRDRDSEPHDPEGSGWFGATQPGRQDGVGYDQKFGEVVTFTYAKPVGVPTPASVRLYYQTRAPGGGWTSWSSIAMAGGPPTYTATRGPYQHGTELRWYVRYSGDVVRFDPGGDAAPGNDEAYYLCWFSHYNPYADGLPEMLADYGGIDVRHGTDFYEFDGSESVQPQLLNLARWVLSWLGGDCCTGEYDTCAETDDRCDTLHHNPRFRGGDDGLCCVAMPIRFRWSGSNVHPHYLTGGKAGGLDPQPLHSVEWDAGDEFARKSWRGINMLYADNTHFNNPYYGGGYSWGTAPGTFVLMYKATYDPLAQVYAKYPSWGLRLNDVIEAVHIQEIVDAVDYLIDYGAWTTIDICTRKRTPGTHMGYDCGTGYGETYDTLLGTYGSEYERGCLKCCENSYLCVTGDELGLWTRTWPPGTPVLQVPFDCDSWTPPTWEDCTTTCETDKCHMQTRRSGWSHYNIPSIHCTKFEDHETFCDGYDGAGYPGCGRHRNERCCYSWDDGIPGWVPADDKLYYCDRLVEGYSFYACGPTACNGGWDDDHGGLFKKNRLDHGWHPGLYSKATGPPGNEFSGNCLGDMFACGEVYPTGVDDGLWFEEVAGVYWEGMASSWFSGCTGKPACGSGCPWSLASVQALPSEIPGYGLYDANGDPLCNVYYHDDPLTDYPLTDSQCDGHLCECAQGDFAVCKGEAVWVAVDLNLDGEGRPYRNFPGRNGDLEPHEGRGIPRLRNYDLTKNPASWMHDCPCETWTGAATCVV